MSKVTPPKYVKQVLITLQSHGYPAYLVGGCVRDMILGVHPQDWDVCTSALPEEVRELFPHTLPTGIRHGTVTVMIHSHSVEVTTFRTDGSYLDHRHPEAVSFVGDLTSDLARRDFTMNAVAADENGTPGTFAQTGGTLTVNGEELKNGVTPIDASAPVTLVGRTGSLQKEYRLVIRNTGLPVVRIQTPGNKSVTSKETWMEGASMRIENPDGTVDFEGTMSIRGRGNSTWNYPKKPYAIKLDSKAKVLGMPKHKRWVLLANWKDRTLLRNDAAFWLSRQTGLPYTVRGQFVEVEFNGKHVGNYYLCEQIKIDKNRVDIVEMEPQETDPELITGGYLMELDTYFDEPRRFRSKYFNHPYQFKEPDEEDLSDAAYNYMVNYIAELEKLMRDTQRVKDHEYEEYYDVDSAIWFMFINELATNTDFHNYWPSEGPHSMYLYKARGGKLYTGPVWDFDFHGFLPSLSHQWAGADKALYYPALYKDERFRSRMLELWDSKKDTFRKLTAYIDEMAEHIRLSEEFNHALWPIPTYQNENGDEQMTFQQAVERIKQGFTQKLEWMDKHLSDLK